MGKRGFLVVKGYEDKDIHLPIRKTKDAAGYDLEAAIDITIPVFKPGIKPTLVPTGLKAYCAKDEYIMLVNRSSGPKKGLFMANGIGIVDSDYFENEENDGHIFLQFFNCSNEDILIHKGDAIGQALFQKYAVTDDDVTGTMKRKGGFGSTDK